MACPQIHVYHPDHAANEQLANQSKPLIMTAMTTPPARVASIHLHPAESGTPMQNVNEIEVVAGRGIAGEPRYFGKLSRRTGQPTRRQVSLIEREKIAEHAATLGLQSIAPGAVRANIETTGIDLIQLIGKEIQIGDAVLFLYEARKPCEQMNAICAGLRALMEDSRQGVMAEVIRPGTIRCQDLISCLATG
jgi:MOSC domain-containing protein YiiM